MGTQTEALSLTEAELDAYSSAALLALQARRSRGNKSMYDEALCTFIGDPLPGSHDFPPLSRVAPSGTTYHYNNPHNLRSSFSKDGTMLNVRHVQGSLRPGDELAEYLVTSADLRSQAITRWRVVGSERHVRTVGKRSITLDLTDKADVASATQSEHVKGDDPVGLVLARRRKFGPLSARLLLDDERGSIFIPADGPAEPLFQIGLLVREVNTLTERFDLNLDALAKDVPEELADVRQIPTSQVA